MDQDQKNLYLIAAKAIQAAYKNNRDLGTTEYQYKITMYRGKPLMVLAIPGTNELADWWENLNLWSTKGVKSSAYQAAMDIHNHCPRFTVDILVCGHSKGGAEAIAFNKLFLPKYCVAFAPARSLRPWTDKAMDNCTIFLDPDDIVSKLACVSFRHPTCKTIQALDDHCGISISDHLMGRWLSFVKDMEPDTRPDTKPQPNQGYHKL